MIILRNTTKDLIVLIYILLKSYFFTPTIIEP